MQISISGKCPTRDHGLRFQLPSGCYQAHSRSNSMVHDQTTVRQVHEYLRDVKLCVEIEG